VRPTLMKFVTVIPIRCHHGSTDARDVPAVVGEVLATLESLGAVKRIHVVYEDGCCHRWKHNNSVGR
jgi:hypothetical protein